jgi:hypothetical protein
LGLQAAVFPRNTSMAPPITQAAEKSSATTAPIHHHMPIASPALARARSTLDDSPRGVDCPASTA